MGKHRHSRATKAAVAGTAIAAAVGMGLTPTIANAVSSNTYFIGFPDWLPIGEGNTLESNPNTIYQAILDSKDTNPLIGWGTGGVDLKPAWVQWIDGAPQYTLPVVGQTGSHTEANPLYQTAYNSAYQAALKLPTWLGGCGGNTSCATQKALQAVANISPTVTVPDYGITEDGYWTTTTAGQWVTPDDVATLPTLGQVAYALLVAQDGEMGSLAPLLNWTAYLTNVNLIAYGDGAIAAGQAYQAFIDSANGSTHDGYEPVTVGEALTGPRKIILVDPEGKVTLVSVDTTNNPLDLPTIVYPDSGEVPAYQIVQGGGVIDVTLLTLNLLRNPGRANGGLYARFAPIYEALTGVDPVSPDRQDVLPDGVDPDLITNLLTGDPGNVSIDDLGNLQAVLESADGKPIVITIKTDTTWEYDLLSDAPATGSPVAWANSAVAALLPLTLGASLLDGSGVGAKLYTAPDGTIYTTITQDQLPLLAPARLVAGLLSAATGEDINTPVADALEPVLKLLVNTSYTDVVRNEDGTWTRTLDQMHVPTLFGTQTLTRQQAALLAGDIIAELGKGVGSEYTDVVQRVTNRVVKFLEDNDIQVPVEIKEAAAKLAVEPGNAIRTVSRQLGDGVSKVLTGVEANLPEAPAAPTQEQLAAGQRQVGKVLRTAKDGLDAVAVPIEGAAESSSGDSSAAATATATAGKEADIKATKQVSKVQKSLTHAQERADKVADKLKQGDLNGAAKQVGENIKNRVDRLKKDVNNGVDKLKGKNKNDSES
ncbi:PE-PPE domain-containing protein [Mycolicibacterium porcinum]|uniref:PE-PPE domain-containing protein n=1 Tax=Mycolicibacterium porcinum TaxID=39693 RepID=UPI000A83E565|nr:PE-PPE domain-containing protein [Mycolicibacterium porcinum]